MYSVKELFYTLQGEGHQAGRAAVFCRFSGCNLWSGREQDRHAAICSFCDTDFIGTDGVGGSKFTHAEELVAAIKQQWPAQSGTPYVVFTGGEPALQLDETLIDSLQKIGFECAVETNGTRPLPSNLDWVCLSPKGHSQIVLTQCDELKLVFPQPEAPPERFEQIQARFRFLSPLNPWDTPNFIASDQPATQAAIAYCMQHPQWRLSLQTHKFLDID